MEKQTLLHTTTDRRDWPLWFEAVDYEGRPDLEDPAFETLDMAVRAAEAGHGVAIGDLSLIGDDIDSGKLLIPIAKPFYSGRGIYFVCPKDNTKLKAVACFRDWLLSDAPITKRTER